MSPQRLHEMQPWRIDNLYSFAVAVVIGVFTFASLYFAIVNRLNLMEQKQDYMIAQLEEMKLNSKARREFNDETRNRVTILETRLNELVKR